MTRVDLPSFLNVRRVTKNCDSSHAITGHCRARDSSAVRNTLSVVVVDSECGFEGPACDEISVGSGCMV